MNMGGGIITMDVRYAILYDDLTEIFFIYQPDGLKRFEKKISFVGKEKQFMVYVRR